MEKTIPSVFEEPMSSHCEGTAWYGIGLDDDFILTLQKSS